MFETHQLERYLSNYFDTPVTVLGARPLGANAGEKGFGYGVPVLVTLEGAPIAQIVVHTAGSAGFGHDTLTDHAVEALIPYETFNTLPNHVPALDVGVVAQDGALQSLRELRDFFWVTGYKPGQPYFQTLGRVSRDGATTPRDIDTAVGLAQLLVRCHRDKRDAPELYRRRVRDLFGHHECISGMLDSYDAYDVAEYTSSEQLLRIEHQCVDWRARLKACAHRLSRVHGDYHPWNVLIQADGSIVLLDRSRGEWGEPADDLSCMAINYLFFSLQRYGRLEGPFEALWTAFFETYLAESGDGEVLALVPPFFAWRGLVVASPLWYPNLDLTVRRALFRFIDRVLACESFAPGQVNELVRP